jgi:hypothetical protein
VELEVVFLWASSISRGGIKSPERLSDTRDAGGLLVMSLNALESIWGGVYDRMNSGDERWNALYVFSISLRSVKPRTELT